MKKKIRDVTCKEYLRWANDRAADGRVLKTCKYSYSDFLKLIALNKFINIGNEMIVSSHIVSFWKE